MPKKNTPQTELGSEIRATRERLRYSQDGLGEVLSVSGTIISRWETGKYKPPIESLARLADLAGRDEAECNAIYSRWVHLAGYREPLPGPPPAPSVGDAGDSAPSTTEGAMARAIIDRIPDPERRLRLVLRLREWEQQWPEDAAGSAPAPDQGLTRQGVPAAAGCGATGESQR